MYKIAVLGDWDSIFGFATLGLDTFPISDPEEGARVLKELAESDYGIIYITEALAAKLDTHIQKYADRQLPAIILIPGASGNTGAGIAAVKRSVEKAVGSDIIFNN
ncbi:MAG: V-type ATP synthase subunit F [Lachnospiraceae bacterium]|nr:V-type ATP synthase subunit F [Lachnospiraceae bacterium]